MFENLSKICQNIQVLLKSDKITVLFMQTDICAVMELFLCSLLVKRNMCQTNAVDRIVSCLIFFFNRHKLYEILRKIYGTAGQARDDNILLRMRFV